MRQSTATSLALLAATAPWTTACQAPTAAPAVTVQGPPVDPARMVRTNGVEFGNVRCELQDRHGNLWFSTSGEGVYRYDGRTFTNFTTRDGLIDDDIGAMVESHNGDLLFGTKNGICKFDGRAFAPYSDHPQLRALPVMRLLEDRHGDLWIGTMSSGAYRFDGKQVTHYWHTRGGGDVSDGVKTTDGPSRTVINLYEDRAGNVWFCSWSNGGVCRFDGTSFTTYVPSAAYYATEDGRVGQGPLPTRFEPAVPETTIADDMIFGMTEDRSGNLWFATRRHGACKFDGTTFTSYREHEGFVSSGVYAVIEDRRGKLWFATEKTGVWRYDPEVAQQTDGKPWTNFTTADGLVHDSVVSALEDRDGNLWFGTRGFGLSRYDGQRFVTFSQ